MVEFARFVNDVDETVLHDGDDGNGGDAGGAIGNGAVNAGGGANAGGGGGAVGGGGDNALNAGGKASNEVVSREGHESTATQNHHSQNLYSQMINERIPRVLSRTSLLQADHVHLKQSVDTAKQVQHLTTHIHTSSILHSYPQTITNNCLELPINAFQY